MSCIYCGSGSYGKPCLFSPTNTHVHADAADKCIYCGSKGLGNNCLFNPYANVHVRPAAIFSQIKEQTKKSAILCHLFEMLEQKSTETINSPLDRLYKRMATTIKRLSEPLLEAFSLQEKPVYEKMEPEKQEQVSMLKKRLEENLSDLRKTIRHANYSLPTEIVEKVLADAILSNDERVD